MRLYIVVLLVTSGSTWVRGLGTSAAAADALGDSGPSLAAAQSGAGGGVHRLLNAARQLRSRGGGQRMLTPRDIQRALYLGDLERIRNFVRRMVEGENVTIVLLGGSVSKGMGAVAGEPSFEIWLRNWLAAVSPGPGGVAANSSNVRVVNAACPATSSAYMNMCLQEYLPDDDIDMVLVEYAINDQIWTHPVWENEARKSFEQLLRKVLQLPKHPAVVLLDLYRWDTDGFTPAGTKSRGRYYTNTEGEFFELATYYGLQLISLKAAVYRKMVAGVRGFQVHTLRHLGRNNPGADPEALFYEDPMHPSGLTGHRVISELVTGLLLQVARGLAVRPWRQSEAELTSAPLPTHLIAGNVDTDLDRCSLGDKLRAAAVEAQGFTWLNEGRNPMAPKWGFTATEPGSTVTLELPSAPAASNASAAAAAAAAAAAGPGSSPPPGNATSSFVLIILAYLRSYENMGVAEATCSGGCVCGEEARQMNVSAVAAAAAAAAAEPPKVVARLNGHWQDPTSQLQLGCFPAALLPPASCRVTIRVATETHSGGHKVKLGGLIISHTAPVFAMEMCMINLEAAQRAAGFRER